MTVEASLAALSDVEASLLQAMNVLAPLTRKNPPLPPAKLRAIQSDLRGENPSSFIRVGDDVLGGIFRYAIGTAKANVVMARRILTGPNPSRHLSIVARLVDSAKHVVRQLEVATESIRTVQDWTGAGRSASSLTRLSGLGFAPPMWLAGLALIAGIVILVVGVLVLVDTMQRAQNAEIALRIAREACDRAQASGSPCTPDDFQQAYEEAARAQNEISPSILNPDAAVGESLGDLVFWGGLLAIGAGVGYAVWITLPAAQSIRQRGSLIR